MENSKHLETIKKSIYQILQKETYGTIMESKLMSVIELVDLSEDINKKQLQLAYTRGKNDVLQEIVNRSFTTSPETNSPKKEWNETEKNMRKILKINIANYDFPTRVLNCLKYRDIITIGDLVKHKKEEVLGFRNFGKKSFEYLEDIIDKLGLTFGLNLDKYRLHED
jgi:DNA-directed RNA polymerase alpha subunit